MNLILSLKVSKLRQLVAVLESVGELQTYTPHDFDAWRATHDTNPTTCALLPMQDVLLNDPKQVYLLSMNYKFRTTTNNSNSDKSVVKLLCTPQEAETWKHSAERLGMSRNQYLRHLISANAPGLPVRPKR